MTIRNVLKIRLEGNAEPAMAALDDRARQIAEKFLKETLHDRLIADPAIQDELLRWLDEGEYSQASSASKRQDLKRFRIAAQKHPEIFGRLLNPIEDILANKRNAVAQGAQKSAKARMINQEFLRGIQARVTADDVTETEFEGYLIFIGTLMTGLRPSEWPTATVNRSLFIEEEGAAFPVIIVKTAKTKDHQEERTRHLILEGFQDSQIELLEECINIGRRRNTSQKFGSLSRAFRKLAYSTTDADEHGEALESLDMASARKIYTVEARRAKRTKKEVAAALGHTTIINIRSYDLGNLTNGRQITLPLARARGREVAAVRDTLKEFSDNNYKTVRRALSEDALDTPD